MGKPSSLILSVLLLFLAITEGRAAEKPLPQAWDYAAAMKKVAAHFHGRPGVVLHVGDSITYSNPYGQWPRAGEGKTKADKAALQWMHAGADNDTDGWWLPASTIPKAAARTRLAAASAPTRCSPAGCEDAAASQNARRRTSRNAVVLMLGTNDASAKPHRCRLLEPIWKRRSI